MATRAAGTAMISTGKGLLKGGAVTLAVQATFGASYAGTTIGICNANPDY